MCTLLLFCLWRKLNCIYSTVCGFFFLPLAAVVYCNINGKIVPRTGLRAETPVDRANHISTASTDLKLKFRLAWLIYYKVKEMFVQK